MSTKDPLWSGTIGGMEDATVIVAFQAVPGPCFDQLRQGSAEPGSCRMKMCVPIFSEM